MKFCLNLLTIFRKYYTLVETYGGFMKQNKYDDNIFFEKYGKMPRSIGGLDAAGEWPVLKSVLPDLNNKRLLDLGCGYGWHCRYAIENNAKEIIGVDISKKMPKKAISMTNSNNINNITLD
jgi:tRNA G46 methylase TrmB